MKKIAIIWDNEAKRSLRNIFEHVKNRESIHVATKVRNEIIKQTKSLYIFPEKLAEEPALKDVPGNFRFKVVWSYKIIYEVTEGAIYIVDIFHTSRDPSNILID